MLMTRNPRSTIQARRAKRLRAPLATSCRRSLSPAVRSLDGGMIRSAELGGRYTCPPASRPSSISTTSRPSAAASMAADAPAGPPPSTTRSQRSVIAACEFQGRRSPAAGRLRRACLPPRRRIPGRGPCCRKGHAARRRRGRCAGPGCRQQRRRHAFPLEALDFSPINSEPDQRPAGDTVADAQFRHWQGAQLDQASASDCRGPRPRAA